MPSRLGFPRLLEGPSPWGLDHVFLYRNRQVGKDFFRNRIKAAGNRCGVPVTAHRLRHTYATQLVNAGCRITSLQKLLGHERLNSTMIYAKVYDATVEDDYFRAMDVIEHKLHFLDAPSAQTLMVERILNLLDSLQEGPLNTKQQATLNELKAMLHQEIKFNQTTRDAVHTFRNGVLN